LVEQDPVFVGLVIATEGAVLSRVTVSEAVPVFPTPSEAVTVITFIPD
jgi:hypothetical protein